jgi:hypothetical protein
MRRLKYSTFFAPAFREASDNNSVLSATLLAPVCDNLRNTIDRKPVISPNVVLLLIRRCPADVSWLVMTIVILPIQRMVARWTASNVRQKLLEGREPKLNTTTAVASVFFASWVFASSLRLTVGEIFRSFLATVCLPVNEAFSSACFAATGQALSATKRRTVNFSNRLTYTLAKPLGGRWDFASVTENLPVSENSASEIDKSRVSRMRGKRNGRILFRHLSLRNRLICLEGLSVSLARVSPCLFYHRFASIADGIAIGRRL